MLGIKIGAAFNNETKGVTGNDAHLTRFARIALCFQRLQIDKPLLADQRCEIDRTRVTARYGEFLQCQLAFTATAKGGDMKRFLSIAARSKISALYMGVGLTSFVALTGCATMVNNIDGSRGNYLVEMALSGNVADLKSGADHGYPKQQFAYGLILEFGLQGVPQDQVAGEKYKQMGARQTGEFLEGGVATGPAYTVNPIEARSAEECLQWLQNPRPLSGADESFICGGAEGREKWKAELKR